MLHHGAIQNAAHVVVATGFAGVVEVVVQTHVKDTHAPPDCIDIPQQAL
jgi:hypothetical protein